MDVDTLKKTAKSQARRNGTSHQAELNRIAREHGHTHWGALLASTASPLDGLPEGSYLDHEFSVPTPFVPIAHAPRDGTRILVVGGSTYAAACWRSEMWTYPSGGRGEPDTIVQLDFEPTHFAKRDDADAERGTMAASTPRMLRGLVERVEGIPEIELRGRMMLGAQFHLQAAESHAKWTRETGPRPANPTRRPEGLSDVQWVEHLVERAKRVDIDPEALHTLQEIRDAADLDAVVSRNAQIIQRMRV